MARASDWSVAVLSADPVPGDPVVIRALAVSWSNLAEDAEWARGRVTQLLGDDAVMDWIGKAGDAFRSHSSDLPGQLDKASRSYRSASVALNMWSGDLEGCQASADKGLALAQQAHDDVVAAQRVLATARANEASAQNASQTLSATASKYSGQPAPAGVQLPDPSQVAAAANRAAAANSVVGSAQHTVGDAQARLAAAKKMIADAASLRDERANTAARSIREAAGEGIPPDSFWDSVGDALSEVWHGLVQIAKIVVLVGGIIALIIGGPLAWIVFAAALLVLADTLAKYADGKASLLDVGLAALSCIPMTKGLTTLTELSQAFKAGGMLGAGAHLLSSARTVLVDMVTGIRSLTSGLKTTIVNFRDTAALRGLVGDTGALRLGDGVGEGLTDADHAAFSDYSGPNYREINGHLRGTRPMTGDAAADIERRAQAISDALAKLPPHEGMVYRGVQLPDDILAKYQPGETIREDAFTSASSDSPFPGNAQFTIHSFSGKDIASYSVLPHEDEVLFDKGTKFVVLTHDVVDGVHSIQLKEIP